MQNSRCKFRRGSYLTYQAMQRLYIGYHNVPMKKPAGAEEQQHHADSNEPDNHAKPSSSDGDLRHTTAARSSPIGPQTDVYDAPTGDAAVEPSETSPGANVLAAVAHATALGRLGVDRARAAYCAFEDNLLSWNGRSM